MVDFPDHSGPPSVVLLHGFCESPAIFDSLLPQLPPHFPTVVPTLPGHGQTPWDPSLQDISALAEWLLTEIQSQTRGPFVLVGHSLGGYIAAALAIQGPDQLKGLMMLHSTALTDTPERRVQRLKAIRFIEQHGPEHFYPQFLKSLFPDGNPQAMALLEPIVWATPASTIVQCSRIMSKRPNQVGALAKMDLPIHYFAGKEDAFIPLERIREEQQALPNVNWEIIPGIGHMGMYEAPDRLLRSIVQLMEKVES